MMVFAPPHSRIYHLPTVCTAKYMIGQRESYIRTNCQRVLLKFIGLFCQYLKKYIFFKFDHQYQWSQIVFLVQSIENAF